MTATTSDRKNVFAEPMIESYPVAADEVIPLYVLVCANATGYAANGADTASFAFLGVSLERVDNTDGLDGAKRINVRREGAFRMKMPGAALTDVGKKAYIVDNQTVTTNAGSVTNDVPCGVISQVDVAAGEVRVDIGR